MVSKDGSVLITGIAATSKDGLKITKNGKYVCTFGVNISKFGTDAKWVNVNCWGQEMASRAAAVSKGDGVMVVGDVQTREYMSGGEKKTSKELNATVLVSPDADMRMIASTIVHGNTVSNVKTSNAGQSEPGEMADLADDDDVLPF